MKFGQYELLELIAVGGMAEVFKGRVVAAEGFEKLVAIKRILPDLAEDERFVKMLLTEARIHSALSHRNIVQIHDLGISEDGQYFIVLEYVEGYDLRMITEQLAGRGGDHPRGRCRCTSPPSWRRGCTSPTSCKGDDGQPLGLIHRDVTPSNVLISLAGEVKLSDFGLAKRRHDRSVVGSLKGNLSYMSPEQAMQPTLDRRTDIFSLGAVLFELLTGRRLREITNEVAGWSQVASGVVPSSVRTLRPDLPPAIEGLLESGAGRRSQPAVPRRQRVWRRDPPGARGDERPGRRQRSRSPLGVVNPPRRPRSLDDRALEGDSPRPGGARVARGLRRAPDARPDDGPRAARRTRAARASGDAAHRFAAPDTTDRPRCRRRRLPDGGCTRRARGAVTRADDRSRRNAAPDDAVASASPAREHASSPGGRGRFALLAAGRRSRAPPVQSADERARPGHLATDHDRATCGSRSAAGVGRGLGPNATSAGDAGPGNRQASTGDTGPRDWRAPARHAGPRRRQASTGSTPAADAVGALRDAVGRPPVVRARAPAARDRAGPAAPSAQPLAERPPVSHRDRRQRGRGCSPLGGATRRAARLAESRQLSIATDPNGASLRLDGATLPNSSPTTVTVRRDLLEHAVEAALPGYRPARAIVRYDKTVALSFLMPLQPAPAPPKRRTGAAQ